MRRETDLTMLSLRPRWSEEDGRAAVTAWRQSGKPIAAFADEHRLGAKRMRRWRERFESEVRAPVALVPVDVRSFAADAAEIQLPSGLVVRLPTHDEARFVRLVLALGAAC